MLYTWGRHMGQAFIVNMRGDHGDHGEYIRGGNSIFVGLDLDAGRVRLHHEY
eukprot:CAMPEP_0202919462 /NCGR_PEP_ID=MMETSP1392-20130828/75872_1 /ASSEMBLY_ACC=CAM_ASM_000868 /TAXON_ID=225041 /ORGANISM="Chlamydomonas chlamydogama, Strain SAG 11-48b" /LENGTH=51 /DNA_ID=CAMNT_0049612825 /DNA_START=61 /DNA_END=216 /DNA_ORIENTATION=+